MLPAFRRTGVRTEEVRRLEDAVVSALTPVLKKDVVDGQLVSEITLNSSGTTPVPHGLGRELVGWIVTRKDANAQVWDDQDANLTPEKTLALKCSANVTVDLWVF